MTHDQIVQYFGSQAEAARKLAVSPQVVSAWKSRGSIPDGWQQAIELMTNGQLKRDSRSVAKVAAA